MLPEEARQSHGRIVRQSEPPAFVPNDLLRQAVAAQFFTVGGKTVQDDFDHFVAGDSGSRQPPPVIEFNCGPTGKQVKDFAGRCLGIRVLDYDRCDSVALNEETGFDQRLRSTPKADANSRRA